ncbi:MAG: histidine kinase, partial [Alphaproteobacteria bacterium]|nr:histidine kinase [Alphaproteobacteria bacterium]
MDIATDPTLFAAVAGLAVLAGLLAVILRGRVLTLAAEAEAARRRAGCLEEILLAAPDGFFRWNHDDDSERCSRRLAVLLGLWRGTDSTFAEVIEAFGAAEAAVLGVAVEGLRRNGVGFDLELALRDGPRRMMVVGLRIADDEDRPLSDVLWVRDVTEGTVAV